MTTKLVADGFNDDDVFIDEVQRVVDIVDIRKVTGQGVRGTHLWLTADLWLYYLLRNTGRTNFLRFF